MRLFLLIRRHLPEIIIGVLITAAAFTVYIQVLNFGLVLRDDIAHYAHFMNQAGSWPDLKTITTTPALFPYWVPVTFLSHLIDTMLFGDNPGLHHLSNVCFHVASALLLLAVFRIMTGRLWQSAFVAALFALHPLNVASVVWLGNRSAMVSTVVAMLLIIAYLYFLKRRNITRYLMVVALFVTGLLSRPSIIWLPPMLLLLDFWPLQRVWFGRSAAGVRTGSPSSSAGASRETMAAVLMEKMPLFVLGGLWFVFSALFFKTTPIAAVVEGGGFDPIILVNSFVSLMAYPWKSLFPADLPAYYPFVASLELWPVWLIAVSLAGFCGATLFVFKKGAEHPYLVTGWGWYLIGVAPYIMVCVAQQSVIIERYAYVPLIGIFVIISWGGSHLVEKLKLGRVLAASVAILILAVLAFTSWSQAQHWSDSVSYFRHAVSIRPDCAQTRLNLGEVLFEHGRIDEAVKQFEAALSRDPSSPVAHNHLGGAYSKTGEIETALRHYRKAIEIKPDYVEALNNLANLLVETGNRDEAVKHYRQALRVDPTLFRVHNNLATALAEKGEYDKAVLHLKKALFLKPEYETARVNLSKILAELDRSR